VLDGGDERQRDRLLGLVSRLGTGGKVRRPLEQEIRVGLEPDGLGPAGWLGRLERRLGRRRAARAVAERVQAAVGRDAVEPCAQRGPPLKLTEPAPGREQRLLKHVLGILHGAEHPVAVQLQLTPEGIGELAERLLVSRLGPAQHQVRHRRRLPCPALRAHHI
jgi:hypothetical protein